MPPENLVTAEISPRSEGNIESCPDMNSINRRAGNVKLREIYSGMRDVYRKKPVRHRVIFDAVNFDLVIPDVTGRRKGIFIGNAPLVRCIAYASYDQPLTGRRCNSGRESPMLLPGNLWLTFFQMSRKPR